MAWPRLWRLCQEPAPRSCWELDGSGREVWYVEGERGARVVVARVFTGLCARHVRMSLGDWRRWWVFAREVRP